MKPDPTSQTEWVRATVEQYAGPLTRYAASILGNAAQAQDVVQDTFIRLCAQEQGSVEARLAEWLFTVCRNRALDIARKEGRMSAWNEEEMARQPSPEPSPTTLAEQHETTTAALTALASLPRNQQEVVRLKFQNGLSYEEISRVTHLTVGNVGFLIHAPEKVKAEFPQFKSVESHAELFKLIKGAL